MDRRPSPEQVFATWLARHGAEPAEALHHEARGDHARTLAMH